MSPGFLKKKIENIENSSMKILAAEAIQKKERLEASIMELLDQAQSNKSSDPNLGRTLYEQAKSLYDQMGHNNPEISRRIDELSLSYRGHTRESC